MDEIKIIAELTSLGYKRFNKNFIFLHSSLSIKPATISNFESDIYIYTFRNEENETFYMWSNIFNILSRGLNWDKLEDVINFGNNNLYINSDNFLIPAAEKIELIYNYDEKNTFVRPIINGVDNRNDLGNKKFIVSDTGILFSAYEKVEHKLIDSYNILIEQIKIIKEKTLIGTLNASFEITTCHLIPIDSSFHSNK